MPPGWPQWASASPAADSQPPTRICACQSSGMARAAEPSSGTPQGLRWPGQSPMPAAGPCPQGPKLQISNAHSNENSSMLGSYVCTELALPLRDVTEHSCQAKPQGQHHTVAWIRGRHSAAACLSLVGSGLGTRAVAAVGGGRPAVIVTQTAHASFHFFGDWCLVMSVSTQAV